MALELLSAEFTYQPRPAQANARRVFDYTFRARMQALGECGLSAAVAILAADEASAASIQPLLTWAHRAYPRLQLAVFIVNPPPYADQPGETPARCNWPEPARWRRYAYSDRWARIRVALQLGAWIRQQQDAPGGLLMPAWDTVFSPELLRALPEKSRAWAVNGTPAAVGPFTFYQHSPVPGGLRDYERGIINAMNAAYWRDPDLPAKQAHGDTQGFWGKMSYTPFALCAPLLAQVDGSGIYMWEDDLEIDTALRALGYGVRAWHIRDPRLFRQAPPIFTRADLRRALLRTLHYSLNIPAATVGGASLLTVQPPARLQAWIDQYPQWGAAYRLADTLVAECVAETAARLREYGCSWVDWGRYRYVARVGDPVVEVWRRA